MAYLSNIQLAISVVSGGQAPHKVEVKCTVNFLPDEVTANQSYQVKAYLWEEDEARDRFVMHPDGTVLPLQKAGNPDDFVTVIQNTHVRPNGNDKVDLVLNREMTFTELDDISPSMEKFFATVSVVPSLAMGDWRFSPVVDVDVG